MHLVPGDPRAARRRAASAPSAVVAVLVMAVLPMASCTTDTTAAPGPAQEPTAAAGTPRGTASGCAGRLRRAPLPDWADAGFSGDTRMPHVIGDRGDIAAIIFGHPLYQPPSETRSNKILWVSRVPVTPGDDLRIEARLGERTAIRDVPGGPGPSIIDLPAAGCWSLTLTWSGHVDTMALAYEPPR